MSKQRDVNSWWEKTKFNLPFAVGSIVWIIVFPIMFFSSNLSTESLSASLIFSSLIVGVPTVIVEIVLVYVFKVVKMKPKSSYDIGNIDDYITLQEQFRSGNYEYETLRSKEDIFRAYEVGKKIVFTANSSYTKGLIWMGIIFLIVGLIISGIIILVFNPEDDLFKSMILIIINSICSGFGAVFFILSFLRYIRIPRLFFILAPEGVVYRRFWGGIRLYSWKELYIIPYSVTSTISMVGLLKTELGSFTEIHINLPNGSRLKFRPDDYDLSEFVSLKKMREKLREKSKIDKIPRYKITTFLQEAEQLALALVVLAFKYYSDPSKDKFETRPSLSTIREKKRLEAHKKDTNKEPIFHYLKKNSGKAFTAQSLYNRIDDIGLEEEAKASLDMDTLEEILINLYVTGKISRQDKEGKTFYFS